MKLLSTIEEINKLNSNDKKIACECERCKNVYYIHKTLYKRSLNGEKNSRFCSAECYKASIASKLVTFTCEYCHKTISIAERIFNKNNRNQRYCSHKCANLDKKKERIKDACLNCNNEIYQPRKFCSLKCQHNFNYRNNVEKWKVGELVGYSGKTYAISQFVRKYLFEKYNNKCCKCGWCEKNPITNRIPLEVNHIDGNPANCKEENLELICPNCHSLTPNFRNLNKDKSPRIR